MFVQSVSPPQVIARTSHEVAARGPPGRAPTAASKENNRDMSTSLPHLTLWRLALCGSCALGACQGNSNAPLPSSARLSIPAAYDASASRFQLDLAANSLSESVDNPLFPALPGAAWTYLA